MKPKAAPQKPMNLEAALQRHLPKNAKIAGVGEVMDLGGKMPHRFRIHVLFGEPPVQGSEQNEQIARQLKQLKPLKEKIRAAALLEGFKLGTDGVTQTNAGDWNHSLTIHAKPHDEEKLKALRERIRRCR
ncbi:MAG: hypothetical protein Q8P02_04490 [Candidatus Micrarchaeota archaeon]|nr:hypothetical protein [Candidatus Micrarchaeota archaeon]